LTLGSYLSREIDLQQSCVCLDKDHLGPMFFKL
jgi:hypothetical protein